MKPNTSPPPIGVLETIINEFRVESDDTIVRWNSETERFNLQTQRSVFVIDRKIALGKIAHFLRYEGWPTSNLFYRDGNQANVRRTNMRLGDINPDGLTKTCSECWQTKLTSEFYKSKSHSSGLHSRCKECDAHICATAYYANHEQEKAYGATQRKKGLLQRKEYINTLKSEPCSVCGIRLPPECMDFDHIDPNTKEIEIGKLIWGSCPLERLEQELRKCRLLCCYCHATITHEARKIAYSEMSMTYQAKRGRKNAELITSHKQCPCAICGVQYDPWHMQFDHLDPSSKRANVADMRQYSQTAILAEIAKCQVICIGCHRILTKERGFSPIYQDDDP